jgi:hypothetical protein
MFSYLPTAEAVGLIEDIENLLFTGYLKYYSFHFVSLLNNTVYEKSNYIKIKYENH